LNTPPAAAFQGGDMAKTVLRFGMILALLAVSPLFWLPLRGQPPSVGIDSSHKPKQQSKLTTSETQPDQRGTQNSPVVVDILSRPKGQREAAEAQRDKDHATFVEGWTLFFAGAVALFTGFLAWVGWRGVNAAVGTLKAIQAQGNDTRKALILTERPQLIVRNVEIRPPTGTGGVAPNPEPMTERSIPSGQFCASNIGTTNADICEVYSQVFRAERLPMARPYEEAEGSRVSIQLLPGMSVSIPFPSQIYGPLGRMERVERGDEHIWVMGWIVYLDGLKNRRRTAFCRKWCKDRRRFFAVDDPDYEHAE
jgi:hypothetical protein